MTWLRRHPFIDALAGLSGNPRACVYTEPLWGIPYNLYTPYVTLYMYALGLSDRSIGLVVSVGTVFQIVGALMGGIITDKMGRRSATFFFDLISWSVPCLIWAFSQNFWWFITAAVLNSIWQVTNNSWNCLLVEDADSGQLVNIYAWITVSGLLAVFFAPLSGFLVGKYSLVPAIRALYILAFFMMTAKFVLLYIYSTETRQGKVRIGQTRGQSVFSMLKEYRGVLSQMLRAKKTMLVLAVLILINISTIVTNSFFSLYITQDIGLPDQFVAYFPMVRAAVMLIFLFALQPRIQRLPYKKPMLTGLGLYICGHAFLLSCSFFGAWPLALYLLCEAFGYALLIPQKDSLLVRSVDAQERARITGLIYVILLAVSSPFGFIAGLLSEINRMLPFVLNIAVYISCALLLALPKSWKEETQQIPE